MSAQPVRPTTTITGAPFRPARIAMFLVIAAVVIACAHLADLPVASNLINPNATDADWGRMLRVGGYVPTWILVSLALLLIDRARLRSGASPAFPIRDMWSRAVLLTASAAVSGLLDEGIKLIVRRERPVLIDGHAIYAFRAFADAPFSSAGLGMPSSHTAVAFGAAFMLARLYPAATPIWLIIAAGCAATRVMARAHFVSDVVAAAFLGYAVAWALWQWHAANARRAESRAPGAGSGTAS